MPFNPTFTINHTITGALTQIERARGFLEAANLSNEWIARMQARAFVLEAHHTTHIEGTHLTLDQSDRLLAGDVVPDTDPDDVKELRNYRRAFELVASYLGKGDPITEALLREIHMRLVEGVRGNSAAPGEYRKVQNYVANSKTKEIIYTPPPAYQVPMLMAELVDWLRGENEINPVLVAGIAQFYLVDIHPFLDGNGRTARLLSTLCLFRSGYDFKRLFTISEYYDRNRVSYYEAIQAVRNCQMDLTPWLQYFVVGLATQMHEIRQKGEQAIKFDLLSKHHDLSERERLALEQASAGNGLTIQSYAALCPGTSIRTLQRELKKLVQLSLLRVDGTTNDRRYRANL